MREPDAFAPQPIDLRRQLELHLGKRHPAPQTGDNEWLPRTAERPSSSTSVGSTRRKRGRAVHERQMNADAERRAAARATDRVKCGWSAREQAGAGQDRDRGRRRCRR